MDVVEVKELYKSFMVGEEEVKVLNQINFTVEEGEFISIMGPSGGGKSTLLYLIGGLDDPTKGTIKIKGKDISSMKDKERSKLRREDIGFVFQFYNLVPNLSLEENVLLPVLLDGKSVKQYRKQLDEMLDLVELSNRKKHTPSELSGGQQQRVAIARALINDPDIILADEPIGNLDSKTGMEIMGLFKLINKEKNKTIIQVTHSKEASLYGKRIVYIKDGSITDY